MVGHVIFFGGDGKQKFSFDYRTHIVSVDEQYLFIKTFEGIPVFIVPRENLINFVVEDYEP